MCIISFGMNKCKVRVVLEGTMFGSCGVFEVQFCVLDGFCRVQCLSVDGFLGYSV